MAVAAKKYILNILATIFTLACSLPNGMGFIIIFPIIIAIPYYLIKSIFYSKNLESIIKLCIWGCVSMLVLAKHVYVHNQIRQVADNVVHTIMVTKQESGNYPYKLEDIGLSSKELRAEIQIVYIYNNDGEPTLGYPTEFSAFESYLYLFKEQKWKKVGG